LAINSSLLFAAGVFSEAVFSEAVASCAADSKTAAFAGMPSARCPSASFASAGSASVAWEASAMASVLKEFALSTDLGAARLSSLCEFVEKATFWLSPVGHIARIDNMIAAAVTSPAGQRQSEANHRLC
jgi:hypothetical protein